jgi:dTDP-glucose 4,6-dehydratase
MRKLLVTGGAGFIGVNFVRYWLEHHPRDQILVLDALTYAGNRSSLDFTDGNANFEFIHGDILDQPRVEQLLEHQGIDTLVHFAAESHVDRSISGPDKFLETNILGTHSLLKAAKNVWLDANAPHHFHHISTDEVYGSLGAKDPAFCETTPYAPNSPYAASKAASDHLVRAYCETWGLQATTSNCSNNYGPYQFPEKLIPLMLINVCVGKPLPVYGDGLNIRDWLYVDDHSRGIDRILSDGATGESYNLGGNNEWKNIDIVHLLCASLDARFTSQSDLLTQFPATPMANGESSASLITFVEDRPGHDRRYAIDSSKAKHELGYQATETFESGLQNTLDWYFENESWWRMILQQQH